MKYRKKSAVIDATHIHEASSSCAHLNIYILMDKPLADESHGAIVIDAIQWNGSNIKEVIAFTAFGIEIKYRTDCLCCDLVIRTLEGDVWIKKGNWIIKGAEGGLYALDKEIFDATYQEIETSS